MITQVKSYIMQNLPYYDWLILEISMECTIMFFIYELFLFFFFKICAKLFEDIKSTLN